jgi:hypothetical protein
MFSPRKILVAIGTVAICAAPHALAQDRPSRPLPSNPPDMNCRPAPPPTGGAGQSQTDRGAPSGNPTDKLAESGGVICPPPNVDRSMQKPVPDKGKTPVIPPPGSPGSGSPVQPK